MKPIGGLRVEFKRLDELAPDPRNARTHSEEQIELVAKSIEEFGFINPIIVDEAGRIMEGHARHKAAVLLGLAEVPTIQLSHMTSAQKQAYLIADNGLAEQAGWNFDILGEEISLLLNEDIDFDTEVIGFDSAEINQLVFGESSNNSAAELKQFFDGVFETMSHHSHFISNFRPESWDGKVGSMHAYVIGMGHAKDGNSVTVQVRYRME